MNPDVLKTSVDNGIAVVTLGSAKRGLTLERNLFMRLCITDEAVARMRSYERLNITSPARSIEVGPEFQS